MNLQSAAFPLRCLSLALCAIPAAPAWADDYPKQAIRIVVPFTAGGSSDVQARMLGEQLGKLYKQNVMVENKPGAGGHIGGKSVVDAPADGHTLMVGSIGLHATYGVYKKLNYNPGADFKIVTVLAEMPHVVVTSPKVAAADLQQLVGEARKNPGALNFGSAGIGSSVHMIGELFKQTAQAPLTHIPYRGSSAAIADLIGGQIEVMFENPPTTLEHVRSGKLKALAVTTARRSSAMPELPTMAEAGAKLGLANFDVNTWFGLFGPARLPADVTQRLHKAFTDALASPEVKARMATLMAEPSPTTPEQFAAFVKGELAKYEGVVKASGARLE